MMMLVLVLALLVAVKTGSRETAAYSNSVPMPITVGNPLFILQEGQSPLHVVLPVVCSKGEFPNDYFHRTKSRASENTNTTEICVSAKD